MQTLLTPLPHATASNTSLRARTSSRGAGLVQVLVTLAVVAILFSLILVGVQTSREAARRALCLGKLHGLGIAQQQYIDVYRSFPPAIIVAGKGSNIASAHWLLLPFLSDGTECHLLNFSFRGSQPANTTGIKVVGSLFVCPSCPIPHMVSGLPKSAKAPTSYACNVHSGDWVAPLNGVYAYKGSVRPSDVTDGLSKTVAFAEIRFPETAANGSIAPKVGAPLKNEFSIAIKGDFPNREEFISSCLSAQPIQTTRMSPRGTDWSSGNFGTTGYNSQLPPNQISCHTRDGKISLAWASYPAGSWHAGGANALFADGSVRFVPDSIDERVWRAAGSRNGGETTSF